MPDAPQNVLITGASSGIGEAVAERYRRAGDRVFLTGRRTEAPPSLRESERYLPGDLGDESFVGELFDAAYQHLGPLDAVVLCHGMQASGSILDTAVDQAARLLEDNVLSAFTAVKHAVSRMSPAGGAIVLVSSRLGMVGVAGQVMYTAAKGGLIMLGKGAAIELASKNIRVNVVAPGLTETPTITESFNRHSDPDARRASSASTIPLQRLARPDEVAEPIYFLGSRASSYITGAVLPVDGGYTAA